MNKSHPFEPFNRLRDDLERVFGAIQPSVPVRFPPLNVWEADGTYFVEAELPGLKLDDLEILIEDGNTLTISGTRPKPIEESRSWHRRERAHGDFKRALVLDHDIDVDAVTAKLIDGLLTVSVPKIESKKSRRIQVET